jgi:hypothetical protein
MANSGFWRALFGGSIPQHHATPERKQRRRIVKIMGRRQAVQHIKDMRSLAKVEALIERIASEKAEVRRA